MDGASIAIWDVPLPVVAGERFAIKIGVKSQGCMATAGVVEVCDPGGRVVASGKLGAQPWPDTEALYWVELSVPAPPQNGLAEYTVRAVNAISRFSVGVVEKPQHRLMVTVTEKAKAVPLADVEIRLGYFHARTDAAGRAVLVVCQGIYQLQAWRWAYDASPVPVEINGDTTIEIAMVHIPEEHPDARWVR